MLILWSSPFLFFFGIIKIMYTYISQYDHWKRSCSYSGFFLSLIWFRNQFTPLLVCKFHNIFSIGIRATSWKLLKIVVDVAPCGACKSWIFSINGVLCFLKIMAKEWRRKKDDWRYTLFESDLFIDHFRKFVILSNFQDVAQLKKMMELTNQQGVNWFLNQIKLKNKVLKNFLFQGSYHKLFLKTNI